MLPARRVVEGPSNSRMDLPASSVVQYAQCIVVRPSTNSGIDGIIQLDPPLLLPRTIQGRSYDVRVGGAAMKLTLPRTGLRELYTSSKSEFDVPSFPEPPLAEGRTTSVLAYASISLPLPEQVFAATALRLRWHDGALEESLGKLGVAGEFSRTIGGWLTIVRDWLAAWSNNVREHIELEATPNVRLTPFNRDVLPARGGGSTPVVIQGQTASSSIQLTAALAAASADRTLPLERQLLAAATVQAHRKQFRQCVISACSAVEVALSAAAQDQLIAFGRTSDEASKILNGVSGVVELYRLNAGRKDGLAVSIGKVKAQLATPRNAAAHAGHIPDHDVAIAAVKVARALLEVRPLPTPRSLMRQLRASDHEG